MIKKKKKSPVMKIIIRTFQKVCAYFISIKLNTTKRYLITNTINRKDFNASFCENIATNALKMISTIIVIKLLFFISEK